MLNYSVALLRISIGRAGSTRDFPGGRLAKCRRSLYLGCSDCALLIVAMEFVLHTVPTLPQACSPTAYLSYTVGDVMCFDYFRLRKVPRRGNEANHENQVLP